jgi:uncharacterized protein YecE (DUF72 family)
MARPIRAGMGGWTFEPWRGVFYPKGLRQADELSFASRKVTSIEINATYYSSQKPQSWARWAAETPEGFVFTLKGSRFCTNRRDLSQAAASIEKFFSQGLEALGPKLGPILWQFATGKTYAPDDIAAFLDLLPASLAGLPLRHCLETRNASFDDPRFFAQCAERGVAVCLSDDEGWPLLDAPGADFLYARLMRGDDAIPTCYPPEAIDAWASRFMEAAEEREVFAFFIKNGKVNAPAGAMALLDKAGQPAKG